MPVLVLGLTPSGSFKMFMYCYIGGKLLGHIHVTLSPKDLVMEDVPLCPKQKNNVIRLGEPGL